MPSSQHVERVGRSPVAARRRRAARRWRQWQRVGPNHRRRQQEHRCDHQAKCSAHHVPPPERTGACG
ncbi:MAG: hypothetical protein IH977_06415 [Nitrospinae bacterium]|nr:hypothetical protein [Nitrospinota bacterium]